MTDATEPPTPAAPQAAAPAAPSSDEAPAASFRGPGDWLRTAIVWVFAAAAGTGVLVGAGASQRVDALLIVVVAAVLLAFVLQLAPGRAAGFVTRLAASIAGAIALLGALTGVFALLGAFGH